MNGKKIGIAALFAVLLALAIVWGSGSGYRSGAVIMRIESGGLRSWSLSFDRATDGFVNTHTLRMEEGEDLSADVRCESGETVLIVRQGSLKTEISFGPDSSPVLIPLDDFGKGRLQLKLISYGAKDFKGKFELIG